MSNNSVSFHRVLKAKPEKVYRAFTDANAFSSWIPPYGFLCVVHAMDVKIGGTYKMSFINFSTGNGHSFGGKYLETNEGWNEQSGFLSHHRIFVTLKRQHDLKQPLELLAVLIEVLFFIFIEATDDSDEDVQWVLQK